MQKLICAGSLAFFAMFAACSSLAAQSQAATPPETMPTYRVDDFAPSLTGSRSTTVRFNRGDLMAQNISLRMLLADAFAVGPDTIFGLDTAALDRRFDLRIVVEMPEHLDRKVEGDMRRQVLQAVIADRLKLVAHQQRQELSVLALKVAPSGIKFTAAPGHHDNSGIEIVNNRFSLDADSMSHMAHDIDDQVGRIVVDKTELTGNFDLNFTMPPGGGQHGAKQDWQALSTAMEQQIGLTLIETTAPVKTLAVDHVELSSL